MHRDLVAIFVLELGGNFASAENQGAGVRRHARHHAADRGADVVEVRGEVLVHELVWDLLLRHHHDTVLTAQRDGGDVRTLHGLEGILDLVKLSLRREDGDVAIVAALARHDAFERWPQIDVCRPQRPVA